MRSDLPIIKKVLPLFLLLIVALCVAAQSITVWWYSQTGQATSLADGDIMLLERGPRVTNLWFTLAQLKGYLGTNGGLSGPVISSFSNNRGSVEIGSTVSSTILSWTLSGSTPLSQNINQGVGAIPVGTLSATDSSSYSANRTYTLTVSNANGTATANTSVTFLSKRYWGPSAIASGITDGDIQGLSQELATGFAGFNHTITCSSQYIYFAFPTAFGVPNVNVNGLLNTAWTIVNRPFQNASLYTQNYYIYRSNNLLTGTYIVQLVP